MYLYMNEDVMWERQKDLQREAENSRLWAAAHPNPLVGIRNWVERLVLRSSRADARLDGSLPEGDRDVA